MAKPKAVRIPFEEAVAEPLLFKKQFEALSPAQRAVLKIIYGLPLSAEDLDYWYAFNGYGRYDELGHLVSVDTARGAAELPHVPTEFSDITLVVGRRSGKTSQVSCFSAAYEALCGGHKAFVAERQDPVILQVCQDLDTAKGNLRQFILAHLEASPIGLRELTPIKATVTAEQIRLRSALIVVGPPTIKLRGQAIAMCNMDELAVWPKDKESANPDIEVERAVRPALAQFPFGKIIKTSTPWTEEGLLWEAVQKGTWSRFSAPRDPKLLVIRAPTATFGNPRISREWLARERQKDAEAFRREYLAQFSKSQSQFLNPALLRAAVAPVTQQAPRPGVTYVATVDPAFRRDAFGFCIGHLTSNGVFELDFVQSWRGTPAAPLSPTTAFQAVATTCKAYKITHVVSDQWHSESLQELVQRFGLSLESVPLTQEIKKRIWGDVVSMLAQGRLRLLSGLDGDALTEELTKMERLLTPLGSVQYRGKHDDLAHAFALCVHRALQYGVRAEARSTDKDVIIQTFTQEREASFARMRRKDSAPWYA